MDAPLVASKVLVLASDATLRRRLSEIAGAAGATVSVVTSAKQALARLRHEPMDAVVCQVKGKGQGTRRLLEELRGQESTACIILLGPELPCDRLARLLRGGAFDYLSLPPTSRRLQTALREGLEVRKSFLHVQELSTALRHMNQELAKDRDRLRQWNTRLALLNGIGHSIAATLDADEIARTIGPQLERMVPFQRAAIVWLRPERVWIHVPDLQDHHRPGSMDDEPLRAFLLARARQMAETVIPPGGTQGPFLKDAGLGEAPEVLEVPLMVADHALGMLHLARKRGTGFEAHEREIVQAVCTSLALALRNAEVHQQAQKLAMRDALTGTLNRRALSNILLRKFRETDRYGTPLSLIMADVDHFKAVNDQYGHLVGDALLKELSGILTRTVRAVDVVARYGGEEFAILLPETDLPQALILAERLREAVAGHEFVFDRGQVRLTMSLGVARIPDPRITSVEMFVSMADRALYQAKTLGRNRTETGGGVLSTQDPLTGKGGLTRRGGGADRTATAVGSHDRGESETGPRSIPA